MTKEHATEVALSYRPLFWVAAVYNLLGCVGGIFAPSMFVQQFFTSPPGALTHVSFLHIQLFWTAVFLFGVGYALVAMNPLRNRGVLFLAILGKLHVGIFFLVYWLQGHLTLFAMLGGLGDIIFALFFFVFLVRTKELSQVHRNLLV